jgi:hypothetical protein
MPYRAGNATKGAPKPPDLDEIGAVPMLHRRVLRVSNRLDFAGAKVEGAGPPVTAGEIGIPLEFQWFDSPLMRRHQACGQHAR